MKGFRKMSDMIVPTPNHRDRERALRGALARMRGDNDVLPLLARECVTPTDVDMCIVAAFDALAKVLMLKTSDPLAYLTQWVALERELAEVEEQAAGDDGPPKGRHPARPAAWRPRWRSPVEA
jgi:hypothetical protein